MTEPETPSALQTLDDLMEKERNEFNRETEISEIIDTLLALVCVVILALWLYEIFN